MLRPLQLMLALVAVALVWPAIAAAKGGNYVFDGGTAKQQAEVRVALEASTFNWSIVRRQVVVHLRKGSDTYATKGEIWIDTGLLNAGVFAWGPIQHEYAHQVDFFLLDDAKRATLQRLLGGKAWWDQSGAARFSRKLDHGDYASERFASTLAWSYWSQPENSLKPRSAKDEAAAMEPGRFRQLLEQVIGAPNPAPPIVVAK